MRKTKYTVHHDCTKTFEIEIEAEAMVDTERSQGLSEVAARTIVAALINDALRSLADKGVHISVYETSGYYRTNIDFKSYHFDADKAEGGE
jgi:hypothetical protein